jgi:hypothetical protein
MSKCQRCDSTRIVTVAAHCSDMCSVSINNTEASSGYVPYGLGIGGGDDVEFDLCLDCGQQQGTWPLPESKLERKANGGSSAKRAFVKKQKLLLKQHADLVSIVLNTVELDRFCTANTMTDLLINLGNDDPERIAAGLIALLDEPQYHAMGDTVFGKFDEWEHWDALAKLIEYDEDEDDED